MKFSFCFIKNLLLSFGVLLVQQVMNFSELPGVFYSIFLTDLSVL